jgi:hypothetical protein
VFSFDYPHPEGSPDALNTFDRQLGDLDEKHRELFFGTSVTGFMGA